MVISDKFCPTQKWCNFLSAQNGGLIPVWNLVLQETDIFCYVWLSDYMSELSVQFCTEMSTELQLCYYCKVAVVALAKSDLLKIRDKLQK